MRLSRMKSATLHIKEPELAGGKAAMLRNSTPPSAAVCASVRAFNIRSERLWPGRSTSKRCGA